MEDRPDYRVVCLTGGPCGGKTSSIAILSDLFESLGWKVYRVPETATFLFSGGVSFPELNDDMAYSFQKSILDCMIRIENSYRELARLNCLNGQKTVLICDRGALDPSAYMDRDLWLKMLQELGFDEASLRDHRYDCVIHLVTAAKGAEAFYTVDNNATRTEGIELAVKVDDAVMNAWVGHASLQVIDNLSVANFAEKCDKVVQAVSTRLGLTESPKSKNVKKRKYIIKNYDPKMEFPVNFREFIVEHFYLLNTTNDGTQTRIRRRTEVGKSTVHLNVTKRKADVDGQRVEIRQNISAREYNILRGQADSNRYTIVKQRKCFVYKDHYFQLDLYKSPRAGLVLLEAYLDQDSKAELPPWLECEEVTDVAEYSMYNLSIKPNKRWRLFG